MNDVARYIEHEAGQLIRKARAERDKAWREVATVHDASRKKDDTIQALTRKARAAQARAYRARRQLDDLQDRYDALLLRRAMEDTATARKVTAP